MSSVWKNVGMTTLIRQHKTCANFQGKPLFQAERNRQKIYKQTTRGIKFDLDFTYLSLGEDVFEENASRKLTGDFASDYLKKCKKSLNVHWLLTVFVCRTQVMSQVIISFCLVEIPCHLGMIIFLSVYLHLLWKKPKCVYNYEKNFNCALTYASVCLS